MRISQHFQTEHVHSAAGLEGMSQRHLPGVCARHTRQHIHWSHRHTPGQRAPKGPNTCPVVHPCLAYSVSEFQALLITIGIYCNVFVSWISLKMRGDTTRHHGKHGLAAKSWDQRDPKTSKNTVSSAASAVPLKLALLFRHESWSHLNLKCLDGHPNKYVDNT